MTNKDDAVYPSNYDDNFAPEYGLTKREYFAAMAMQALVSVHSANTSPGYLVKEAVSAADALLEELAK